MQDTPKILAKQIKNGEFNRYDIIIRYLAIENYYGQNNIGFDLYNKMQALRVNEKQDSTYRLISLVQNIEKFGFNNQSPILVDRHQNLIDGSHRFAASLYFDRDVLPLKRYRLRKEIYYGIEWFVENNFNKNELNIIINKTSEIFINKGIYFPIILWPPVNNFFDEIEEKISKKYKIIKSIDLFFDKDFDRFVEEIYQIDDIESWKIKKKMKGMSNYQKNIRVIYIDIVNPKYRKKSINGHDISIVVEKIKRKYRAEYANKVDNYFYDIIIHIGDNYYHNRAINNILETYGDHIY
jgi:hypothetical protein